MKTKEKSIFCGEKAKSFFAFFAIDNGVSLCYNKKDKQGNNKNEIVQRKDHIMNVCKTAKTNQVGETSSKYGYPGGGEQFIVDCQKHEERCNFLWDEFVVFMKSHNVNPKELRTMFTRYHEEFL
jgi:hypothetical protein